MKLLKGIREYLRVPRSARRIERDVRDELQMHIDLRAAELQRGGLSAEEARRAALEQFGDVGDAEQFCREADSAGESKRHRRSVFDELRQDARITWRQLGRHRAFSLTAIGTLAIAIGATTAIYAAVHAYLVRPLPYPNADRLYQMFTAPTRDRFPNAPRLDDVDWAPLYREFPGAFTWDLDGFTVAGEERPVAAVGAWVPETYFSTLGLSPAMGRAFRPDEFDAGAPAVALISHRLWMQHFGGRPGVVGESVRLYSSDRPTETEIVTIAGVLPANTWHINRFTEVLRPLPAPRMPYILPLPPGMTRAQAEARIDAIVRPQLGGTVDPAWRMGLGNLQDEYTRRARPVLLSLLGAAACMLLIAGASVAGAMVARSAARQGELQLRVALGASRGRLVRQLLTESVVLAGIAAGAGVALAVALLRGVESRLPSWLGSPIPSSTGALDPGWSVLLLAVAASSAVCIVFGLAPAWILSRRSIAGGLRRAERGSGGGLAPALRQVLIGAQVAFTMILLTGASLLVTSVYALGARPLGFTPDGVTSAQTLLPESRYPDSVSQVRTVNRLIEALETDPRIAEAAFVFGIPFGRGALPMPAYAEGAARDPVTAPRGGVTIATPGYLELMRIPLRSGRTFTDADDARATKVAVVSADLARTLFGGREALGQRFALGAPDGSSHQDSSLYTVAGVVGETSKPVAGEELPDIYLPYAQHPQGFMGVVVRARGDDPGIGEVMRTQVATVDDALALEGVSPLPSLVERDSATQRVLAGLLATFGGFALGLTLLGLYGALSYMVAQRGRELAVRAAIGASTDSIVRLVLREGSRTTVIGLVTGAIASVWLTRILASRIAGVQGGGVLSIALVGLVLFGSALAALAIPAQRAARVDPAIALRGD
ncbi:MAG: ABC transporter permease [Cytophagaceae bacterium]|nr:ABC transporter permease [Gemmatimonadaceae bacterium]